MRVLVIAECIKLECSDSMSNKAKPTLQKVSKVPAPPRPLYLGRLLMSTKDEPCVLAIPLLSQMLY